MFPSYLWFNSYWVTNLQDTLEDFDGVSKGKYTIGLGQDCMAFCSEVEDVISMGLVPFSSISMLFHIQKKKKKLTPHSCVVLLSSVA